MYTCTYMGSLSSVSALKFKQKFQKQYVRVQYVSFEWTEIYELKHLL